MQTHGTSMDDFWVRQESSIREKRQQKMYDQEYEAQQKQQQMDQEWAAIQARIDFEYEQKFKAVSQEANHKLTDYQREH